MALNASLTRYDMEWVLTLFGTAIGAGILFLPIQAGLGGIWPMIILTVIIFPLTYYSHRGITRLVASNETATDITGVVEQDLGRNAGFIVSILYFLSIITFCVGYATGVTNIVSSFLENQLGMGSISRPILTGILLTGLTGVILAGEKVVVKVTSIMVYPLIAILFALSLYMIPYWNFSMFTAPFDGGLVAKNLLLTFPVLVFAMNFSPICSALGRNYREQADNAEAAVAKTDRVVFWNSLILLVFVMFFVFSIVLSQTPESMVAAKANNIDVLTMISLQAHEPWLKFLIPLVAFIAIVSSYFGHFIGTREGLDGMIYRVATWSADSDAKARFNHKKLRRYTTIGMIIGLWLLAVVNPPILKIIGAMSAPIIALYCYIMPVMLMKRVPRLAIYRTRWAALVFLFGLVTIVGYGVAEFL